MPGPLTGSLVDALADVLCILEQCYNKLLFPPLSFPT